MLSRMQHGMSTRWPTSPHKQFTEMLTLKYQGKQRGPQYYFQVESSVNFLSKDLVAIAYSSSGFEENFSNIADQTLNSVKYVVGTIFTSFSQTKYTMMAVSFADPDVTHNIFDGADFTISLLRSTIQDTPMGAGYLAIAHFPARIECGENGPKTLDSKGVDYDLRECKFDTLTFEQLGAIVRLPVKRTTRRQYDNLDNSQLHLKVVEKPVGEDKYFFPRDVFDTDVVFVDLPTKA